MNSAFTESRALTVQADCRRSTLVGNPCDRSFRVDSGPSLVTTLVTHSEVG